MRGSHPDRSGRRSPTLSSPVSRPGDWFETRTVEGPRVDDGVLNCVGFSTGTESPRSRTGSNLTPDSAGGPLRSCVRLVGPYLSPEGASGNPIGVLPCKIFEEQPPSAPDPFLRGLLLLFDPEPPGCGVRNLPQEVPGPVTSLLQSGSNGRSGVMRTNTYPTSQTLQQSVVGEDSGSFRRDRCPGGYSTGTLK